MLPLFSPSNAFSVEIVPGLAAGFSPSKPESFKGSPPISSSSWRSRSCIEICCLLLLHARHPTSHKHELQCWQWPAEYSEIQTIRQSQERLAERHSQLFLSDLPE